MINPRALLPPAEDPRERRRAPADRGTTFFALPSGAILETHGDLSQSEAAARWDLAEAARRERYERDRAAWLTPPPERDQKLDAARAAERAAWTAKHDTKWAAKEQALKERRARERGAWAAKRATKGRRKSIRAKKPAWLLRHNERWNKRLHALRLARAAERAAWTKGHDKKWSAIEAARLARTAKQRAIWAASHAEPPLPDVDANPDDAAAMVRKHRAWEKRRDRLLAPFRPRPFQGVIAAADAIPAIHLCEPDCSLPHEHTTQRKRRAARRPEAEEPDQQRLRFYGRRKRGALKAKSAPAKRILKAEKMEIVSLPVWDDRPRERADCRKGPRPCPWVGCRKHLYLDVKGRSIKINFPDMDVVNALVAMPETCSLDVAERAERREKQTQLEDVGTFMNVTMERARQLEKEALASVKDALIGEDIDLYEDHEDKVGVREEDDDGSGW